MKGAVFTSCCPPIPTLTLQARDRRYTGTSCLAPRTERHLNEPRSPSWLCYFLAMSAENCVISHIKAHFLLLVARMRCSQKPLVHREVPWSASDGEA